MVSVRVMLRVSVGVGTFLGTAQLFASLAYVN